VAKAGKENKGQTTRTVQVHGARRTINIFLWHAGNFPISTLATCSQLPAKVKRIGLHYPVKQQVNH